MAMHLVFCREMAKHGYDVGKAYATALKTKDIDTLELLEPFLPYCFVQLRAKEIAITPETPERSRDNVELAREQAKQFAELKSVPK